MTRLTTASYVKIALIVLLGALVLGAVGLGGCANGWGWRIGLGGGAEMGEASVDAAGVENLSIKWAAGSVDVSVVEEGDAVELVETAPRGIAKAQQMRWSMNGGTLEIDYGSWFSCLTLTRKDLEVRIPKSCAQRLGAVGIDGASGLYDVDGVGCDSMKLTLASGEVNVRNVEARDLRIDVASGQLGVQGRFDESVSVRTASGQTRVVCEEICPRAIDADVASGFVSVAVPEDSGFTAKVEKASGSFNSAFPLTQSGNAYTYGDGGAHVNVHLASGEFRIDSSE